MYSKVIVFFSWPSEVLTLFVCYQYFIWQLKLLCYCFSSNTFRGISFSSGESSVSVLMMFLSPHLNANRRELIRAQVFRLYNVVGHDSVVVSFVTGLSYGY